MKGGANGGQWQAETVKNHQKLIFQANIGKAIAWSSFLSRDIIAKAPNGNSFVNKSRGEGIKIRLHTKSKVFPTDRPMDRYTGLEVALPATKTHLVKRHFLLVPKFF